MGRAALRVRGGFRGAVDVGGQRLPLAASGRIRLLTKLDNEGKAMALNDALPLLHGEIILMGRR